VFDAPPNDTEPALALAIVILSRYTLLSETKQDPCTRTRMATTATTDKTVTKMFPTHLRPFET
jgi:hypothetical protein